MKYQYSLPCVNNQGELIMSLLQSEVILKGIRGQRKVTALFDSGASYSCLRRDIAEEVGILVPLDEPMYFSTADEDTDLRAEYSLPLSFYFTDTNRRFTDEFIVVEKLSEELIVGAKTMQAWKIRLDFDAEEVVYDKKMHKLRI